MKVLWITNTIFPEVCKEINISPPVIGGWMYSSAKALMNTSGNVELSVASTYQGRVFKTYDIEGIRYYLIPNTKKQHVYNPDFEVHFKTIKKDFNPDIIHIHGSEYPYGLAYINACGNKGAVVSIQGIVSIIARYYLSGISSHLIKRNITIRDIIRNDTLIKQQKRITKRGNLENKLFSNTEHVIGRTSWDKAHVWAINPNLNYYFCNETLRAVFYEHRWKYENCEKYSIFLSQAHYPIKGLQQVIQAMPYILRFFPNTKIIVAGNNFISHKGIKINGFGKFIRNLIKTNNIEDRIIFTGLLSENEMCQQYLNSNVFVCPSSIENSPNSVGEAQILGVPVVASYVGGIPDMITNNQTGLLYRFEEVEMLSSAICRIFSDPVFANKISYNAREVALRRHNIDNNLKNTIGIYRQICKNS